MGVKCLFVTINNNEESTVNASASNSELVGESSLVEGNFKISDRRSRGNVSKENVKVSRCSCFFRSLEEDKDKFVLGSLRGQHVSTAGDLSRASSNHVAVVAANLHGVIQRIVREVLTSNRNEGTTVCRTSQRGD
jgi:hypothetical protein